jgi:hypothetical protein
LSHLDSENIFIHLSEQSDELEKLEVKILKKYKDFNLNSILNF